ncbi:substrate-binding domain-containing protein [Halobacteriovorax sp. HLS]|uniref:substrate-binding domain-containing protein n=1 Tax=Halobacteriovorax sp. HLS TaxID=2234000 RepID=UPI000FD9C0F3|nr:substrate-binding domain-containing protein [Halobacteriovorax sp. HLS]
MKILILILVSISNCYASDYLSFADFLEKNPGQDIIHQNFSKQVRQSSVKIKKNQQKKIKISIVYPGKQISDYWKRSVKSFKLRMDELNIDYQIEEFSTEKKQIREQAKNIKKSLKGNPDYLVFTLDSNKHTKLISQILEQRKTKLILQNITTPKKMWLENPPFLYVGFDHERGSQLLIERLEKSFPNGGRYAMLYYTDGYVSKMRGETVIKKLNKNKKWTLLGKYYTDGKEEKVRKALIDLTKREKNIDILFTCATDIAITSEKFEKERNYNFFINGWGGGSAELESITSSKKNGIDYTVMRINDDNGVAMAEAIKLDIENKSHLIPKVFSGEMVIIDKETTINELNSLKARSFRYSDK